MKIVHAADLHLDSPLAGLERYEGAPVESIRGATRRAFQNLVALCLEERAALLLVAGDIYDGDWKDYSTGLFFSAELTRLREAGTRVVIVRGNHDAASQITRHLRLPDHVIELPSARPGTHVFEDLGVAVHGQSFRDRAVTDDLASRYPEPVSGLLNLGLLHTALTGREGHQPYAPCTAETLSARGYDYWALGHVHGREVVSESPWIVFPGNLQGRQARELGPKGATLIEVKDQRILSVEHRPLDVVRWTVCDVDATDAASPDDVVDRVRAGLEEEAQRAVGRIVAARVIVRGATRAHGAIAADPAAVEAQIRSDATAVSDELWVEQVRFGTTAWLESSVLAARADAIGQVARSLGELRGDADARQALLSELSDFRAKLPVEARDGVDAVAFDDPAFAAHVLADVEQLLLPALAALGADE